jgi:predicted Fe-Mo cluster-binding NifX family protein
MGDGSGKGGWWQLKRVRVAVSTKGERGLEDEVSEIFGRTKTITIIDTVDGEVKDVQVLQNPAVSYRFGAGPILVKTLVDMKVDVVVTAELGPGASALIEDQRIVKVAVKPNTPVNEALKFAQQQFG